MSLDEAHQDSESANVQDLESELTHFAAGLPGFEELKQFKFVAQAEMQPFLWLRSVDEPFISLPVINCLLLNPKVLSSITNEHLSLIGSSERSQVEPYYVLKVNSNTKTITANTKAPIIVNTESRQGYQILLDVKGVKFDEPLNNLLHAISED